MLKFVEHAFESARLSRHAELLLDPALIIIVKDQRLLFIVVSTEIVKEHLFGEFRPLTCILVYFTIFEQEKGRQFHPVAFTLEPLTDTSLELTVSDGDFEVSVCDSCRLNELPLELKTIISASLDK